jgi:hypothetical protein
MLNAAYDCGSVHKAVLAVQVPEAPRVLAPGSPTAEQAFLFKHCQLGLQSAERKKKKNDLPSEL